ncbi:MAG: DUF1905 domain-containing protein [Acidobacteria bacterium]|nr:DUF1905 domain-containing protein [Acidobacteriota bacterium]
MARDSAQTEYLFRAPLWLYDGAAAWHFVTVPAAVSAELHAAHRGAQKPGGSVRVRVALGVTRWNTSIFWDRRRNAYLLPIKAQVRAREHLRTGDSVELSLTTVA